MYFDFDYYWRVLKHVWSLRDWPGRRRMLFRLLVKVPLVSVFHGICFLLDYLFFPALWSQKIVNPVFMVGHARSGTTLVHRLMAADGDTFSYFLYWEMFFPSLLQKRIIRALGWLDKNWLGSPIMRRLQAWDDRMFGSTRHIHNMSLWNSEEDQFVMRAAFVTQQWALDIPMMDVIDIFHVDQMPAAKKRRWMHHYRECVKRQLLLNGGNKVHLSKNPVMCGWVDALIETFPDARIGVSIRNPLECMPSLLKLVEVSWSGRGWRETDYDKSLRIMTDISFESFTHPREVLARHPETPQVVVDYRELTRAPRAVIHRIYESFNMTITEEYDGYLQAQEQQEKSHKTSFEYSLKDYDHLSEQQITTKLADFFTQYQWQEATSESQETGPKAINTGVTP